MTSEQLSDLGKRINKETDKLISMIRQDELEKKKNQVERYRQATKIIFDNNLNVEQRIKVNRFLNKSFEDVQ